MNSNNIHRVITYEQCKLLLCIDDLAHYEFRGRAFNLFTEKPKTFSSAKGMIDVLELFMDSINFPHPTHRKRRFISRKGSADHLFPAQGFAQISDFNNIHEKGKLATFSIKIQYRHHSTWQGEIRWLEAGKELYFRSVLELLSLIGKAVEFDGEEHEPSKW